MTKRHSDRDREEFYILTILLAFRPILFVGGFILMVYTLSITVTDPWIAIVSFALALFLFLLVLSDQFALQVARVCAWVSDLGRS